MTKKVTQNVTNSNTKDLTDKLKKGELPDNHHYYYKMPNGKCEVGNTFCIETLHWCKDGDKIEVLCEVPSYEELQNQVFILKSRESEIVKLKELLKECHHIMGIEKDFASCHFEKDKLSKLCEQITEVLADNQIQADTVACNKIQEKNNVRRFI